MNAINTPAGDYTPGLDELIYDSERTRVWRRQLDDGRGTIVVKQPLGPDAAIRLHREIRILERLRGVEGVPQLAAGSAPYGTLLLKNTVGSRLADAPTGENMSTRDQVRLMRQLVKILAAVHAHGVVHKDINPVHILLCGTERQPVLLHFELATTSAEEHSTFVHHRNIAGTLAYLAPELTGRTGRSVDQRADLYAMGAMFYELVTGHAPFSNSDPLRLVHDVLARVPVPPVELRPQVPQVLSAIIMRLLEKDPDRRYQSADGLAHDLARVWEQLERGENELFTLGERDFAPRLLAPSRLVGREAEVRALQAAFRSSVEEGGRSLLISGPPGVGKTALLNELRATVATQRGWFVSGKFDPVRRDTSSDGVHQALRALGRLLLAEPESALIPLRAGILRALGANAEIVAALFPQFELLLDLAPGPGAQDALRKNPDQVSQILLDLLRAIVSPTRPVALVLDDLQWAGSMPLAFFDAVVGSKGLPGLLLAGVCREGANAAQPFEAMLSRWQQVDPVPIVLRLSPLAPAELSVLLADILRLPQEQAQKLAQDMGERTRGNPYETVDLVNALRRDGVLVPRDGGWSWDAAAIRRYVGSNDVADLLAARIDRLPAQTQSLLDCMACLGDEIDLRVLQEASGLSSIQLDERLAPALEDGLVTFEQGGQNTLRFRHGRVRQVIHDAMVPAARYPLQLALARRLAQQPALELLAAEQYLPALQALSAQEFAPVVALMRRSAIAARRIDAATAERLLAAALSMLNSNPESADDGLRLSLEIDWHESLCGLGRLDEADRVYGDIERRCTDPIQRVAAACAQVSSLSSRGKHGEARALGFGLLRQLGVAPPGEDIDAALEVRLQALQEWLSRVDLAAELRRAPATDPMLLAAGRLLHQLGSAAFFSDPKISFWLGLDAQRLCAERGYSAELVSAVIFAPLALLALREDYRAAYSLSQHMRELTNCYGSEHEVLQSRFSTLFIEHWFEPLSDDMAKCESLRIGFLKEGGLHPACFVYHVSVPATLECSAALDSSVTEVDAALALAARSGDEHSHALFVGFRQLLRSLRGETRNAGSFDEEHFDEAVYAADSRKNPMAMALYHINRALAILLFDGPARDLDGLTHHASSGLRLAHHIVGHYHVALAYFLNAMALVARIGASSAPGSDELLGQLAFFRDWLARRAADAPANFLNLLQLVDAEKAWALGRHDEAIAAFDLALRDARQRERPWQSALIAERAGRYHFSRGLEHTGRALLNEASGRYEKWGAAGKVRDLQRTHGFLRSSTVNPYANLRSVRADSGSLSSDSIDMLAILRASQALSSETSLHQLKARVVDLLGALTGATRVLFISRAEDSSEWSLSLAADEGGETLSIAEAGVRGLLPLSIFRYVERTLEPLLLEDAAHDDRFSRDTYFAGLECCSLLLAPILSHGVPRAVLMLESRAGRGAFSADRLDAVMLIAGQLGVSLDNASRYEMLERKVSERTAELAHSLSLIRATLESSTDAVVAVDNHGKVTTFNEHYVKMWDIPRELLQGQDSRRSFEVIATRLKDSGQTLARVQRLVAHPEEESSAIIELHDGRIFEEHSRPQKIGDQRIGRIFCFHEITERRLAEAELRRVHQQLVEASRQGGMAEVATNVLHNVGNVLNSVNVSATLVAESLRKSRFAGLQRLVTLLQEPDEALAAFAASARGKQIQTYLAQLAVQLQADQKTNVGELELLRSHIEHIRDIVTMQQSYATTSSIKDTVLLSDLVEDSLRLNLGALSRHGVEIVREFEPLPALMIEKHKVLQVLVNLISNAKYACEDNGGKEKRVTLRIARDPETGRAQVSVIDNGVGIPEENLTRIFNHGFTTRAEGHGFGLHSSALAAKELGGALIVHSDGVGTGATFTLELPFEPALQS